MQLSREARLVAGVIVLTVPTIMYGGLTLLGILTKGTAGLAPDRLALDDTQWALSARGTRTREHGSFCPSSSKYCSMQRRYRPGSHGWPGSAPQWQRLGSRVAFSASPFCRPSGGSYTSGQRASLSLWS
jgi:hypothetical protein